MRTLNELFIEITNRCMQKCVHCSSGASCKGYDEISFIDIKKLVDDTIPMGLSRVTLSGGEPFLHPEFMAIIQYLYCKKITVSVYTCGVYAGGGSTIESIPDDVFIRMSENNVKRLIFSLHAATEATFEKISGISGSFNLVMKSIEAAIKYGFDVELHVVPMLLNFDELEKILQIADNIGVKQVSFLRFVPQGRGECNNDLLNLGTKENKILQDSVETWREIYSNIHIRLGVPYNCLTFSGKRCTAGHDKLLINASGEVFPCEAFKYMKGKRPNIYDTDIADIWNNDALLNELRNMDIARIAVCAECEYSKLCAGGCPGQRKRSLGSFYEGPDPLCLKMC